MTTSLDHLFANNTQWAQQKSLKDPHYFESLARQQNPQYLWIGCSDSRVPANEIVGLAPGEIFVHRNIANLVVHTDLNCLSVVQFAVDLLQVRHIMVVGHYGCSGIKVALTEHRMGLSDNWLRHIQDIAVKHTQKLDPLNTKDRLERLCELNVLEQTLNVTRTTIVQEAWQRNQNLTIHALVYGLHDGRLRDLNCSISNNKDTALVYEAAIQQLISKY